MSRSSAATGSDRLPGPGNRSRPALGARLRGLYRELLGRYGAQGWWPARSRFEMAAGALLVQNTSWSGVERALARLREARALDPDSILRLPPARLSRWLRPVGTFRQKARRLRILCAWLQERGGFRRLSRWPTGRLRRELLAVEGIGPETADDILLYAFRRPVFVIDAYTRRLLSRLGWIGGVEGYEALRGRIESALGPDEPLFNEFHALIVRHVKEVCRRRPRCDRCFLAPGCAAAGEGDPSASARFR